MKKSRRMFRLLCVLNDYLDALIKSIVLPSISSSPAGTVWYQFVLARASGGRPRAKLSAMTGSRYLPAAFEAVPYFSAFVKTAAFSGLRIKLIHSYAP